MITSVWKPKFENLDKIKTLIRYDNVDIDFFIKTKPKGWIVTYKCDRCESNLIHSTRSSVFFRNTVYNTLDSQTCRSCRSKISEYEIKKNFILYKEICDSLIENNYQVKTTEEEYMKSDKRSQFKFNVVCDKGHTLTVTWNNWEKGKRCRECYEYNKWINAVKNKNGWERYKFLVWHYTEQSYRNNFGIINPNNYRRGEFYHLDHKYSLYEGFINNISPKIIGGYKNLEIISRYENLSKGKKCSVELKNII